MECASSSPPGPPTLARGSRSPPSPPVLARVSYLWQSTLARVSGRPIDDGTASRTSDDGEDVARVLSTDLRAGLSSAEAAARLAEVGKNVLVDGGPPPLLKIVLRLSLLCFSFSFFIGVPGGPVTLYLHMPRAKKFAMTPPPHPHLHPLTHPPTYPHTQPEAISLTS